MAATAHSPSSLSTRTAGEASADLDPIIVGESARFEGLVTFRGRAQVDGEIEGEIVCRGTLLLGETARVRGTIEVDELIVAGALEGEANARERIELTSTARVKGILRAPRLALADGCVVEGRCETRAAPRGS
jgi:cytoskeletal protein CcmA (bactofilin family)